MWSDISRDQPTYTDTLWLRSGMQKGSLVWVTDGSYDRKQAKDLSGVGWIILRTDSKLRITGTFWERSQSANLYRAELLGLCAMHTLAQALEEFYHLSHWSAMLCCDNKKALNVSRHHRQRIKPSTKCADIHRTLRSTKLGFQGEFTYRHVYGHMDQYLPWERLSLIQQMNCVCDTLAKRALTMALSTGYHKRLTHFLSREDAALVVWGEKITGDISQKICFHACKEEARKHLQTWKVNHWSAESFEEVDWEHLDLSLAQKPDMYKIWRSKQKLRLLRNTSPSWQILGISISRRMLPQLWTLRNGSTLNALFRQWQD
jgi:hypothetical protein